MLEYYLKLVGELERLSGKWFFSILIVLLLCGHINFNQLRKFIKPITSKVLSKRLKELEELGLIVREILIEKPLRVEYYLTEKGETIAKSIFGIFEEPPK